MGKTFHIFVYNVLLQGRPLVEADVAPRGWWLSVFFRLFS